MLAASISQLLIADVSRESSLVTSVSGTNRANFSKLSKTDFSSQFLVGSAYNATKPSIEIDHLGAIAGNFSNLAVRVRNAIILRVLFRVLLQLPVYIDTVTLLTITSRRILRLFH